jgi:glycosyltransferase involved in cell wall biosynthesis
MPSLSVVVPATNRPPTLGRCLNAIEPGLAEGDELIVVEEPAYAGPAQARNEGAGRATGAVLLFVDADIELHPDALERVRRAFDEPGLDALFGSYDDRVETQSVVSAFRNLLHHHVHQQGAGPAGTFWAGIGAVRRERFLAAGGFDAARYTRPAIEDVELGIRLAAAGCSLVLDPELQGTHLKRWTLREMVRTDFSQRGVPWMELLLRGRGGSSELNLGWSHRLSALASVGLALGALRRRPRLAAGSLLTLLALNRAFYRLLAARRGHAAASAGVGLHALHLLTAVAAVPAGLLAHLRGRRGAR